MATKTLLSGLLLGLIMISPAVAAQSDLSGVIERFVVKQFPHAQSHFWVINSTEWGTPDEVVVDVNTIVVMQDPEAPTENRFLLLIVRGELTATQSVPLGATIECQPDEVVSNPTT